MKPDTNRLSGVEPTHTPVMGTAYGDESGSNAQLDPNTYILASAVVRAEIQNSVRNAMLALRMRGQRKLHWRDESIARRRKIIASLASQDVEHLVVVRSHGINRMESPKRMRRKCMERVLIELSLCGVRNAVFESRGAKDDARDRSTLDTLRAQRILDAPIRVDHAPGPSEPLLWLADATCGALVASRTGESTEYWDAIQSRATLIEI